MRFHTAIAGLIALASLAGCSGYTASGPYGGGMGGGQGGGGGPVGSVTLGPGIQFESGHNGSQNPAVDTIPVGASVMREDVSRAQLSTRSSGTGPTKERSS